VAGDDARLLADRLGETVDRELPAAVGMSIATRGRRTAFFHFARSVVTEIMMSAPSKW